MTNKEAALDYLQRGLSILPLARDKTPLLKWQEFQTRYPTKEEIDQWFYQWPDCNIGIVTGKISNLTVIDCDSQLAIEYLYNGYQGKTPCVKTPRGMHFYFAYQEGVRNKARITNHIDVRSEGGYVVAPPSINQNGTGYRFINGLDLPLDSFINCFLHRGVDIDQFSPVYNNKQSLQTSTNYFVEGTRDNSIYQVAQALIDGHCKMELTEQVLDIICKNCEPPFDAKEIPVKIKSALTHANQRQGKLSKEVLEYVLSTNGNFLSTDVVNCLQLSTRDDKKNLSIILKRLSEKKPPIIEKVPGRNGHWRKIDTDIEYMDFVNVSQEGAIDLSLPLDIHKKTIFFPKNVIVIAGVTGYGKTSFLLNMMRSNMEKFQWKYFMSEMSPLALNYKLTRFNWPIEAWKMDVIPDYVWDFHNIPDKIFPNAMNVIDYLEPEGERTYYIHEVITKIIKKLDKGMAIIATQKKPQADLSAGGVYSSKAASLYLSLDWGTINIFKNRFREEDKQPLRTRRDFEIQPGQHFVAKGNWYDPNERKRKSKLNEVIDDEGGFIEE